MSFNRVTIVGNLGRDPELRYTPQGTAVTNLNIATTEKRRVNGEFEDVTTWFRVTLWGKQAETAAKYLSKGSQAFITGPLTIEEWTDREGNSRTTLCVNGQDLQFVGGGNGSNKRSNDTDEDTDGGDEFDVNETEETTDEEEVEEEKPAPRKVAAKKPAAKPAPAAKPSAKKTAPAKKKPVASEDDDDDFDF